jgi:hypothetical protein
MGKMALDPKKVEKAKKARKVFVAVSTGLSAGIGATTAVHSFTKNKHIAVAAGLIVGLGSAFKAQDSFNKAAANKGPEEHKNTKEPRGPKM